MKYHVLIPWDVREAITVTEAAKVAGCSLVTVRTWAALHGLGRRVGGRWMLSRVALTMYLDGDAKAFRKLFASGEGRPLAALIRRHVKIRPRRKIALWPISSGSRPR